MWKNDKIKLMAVDGVYPDKNTISDGSYPIRTNYLPVPVSMRRWLLNMR
ncbi:MAG TPA: hypothetical protein VM577_02025 [Anaerovoracaceae bacterium]|nr:hypothetical protein [Anaerovoracaceae bacterium]